MQVKVLTIKSQIEALKIKDILDANEIPYIIRSFSDSVYGNVFQAQLGWGELLADSENLELILELLERCE